MEGVTLTASKPRRGDIVVFKTDGIPSQSPGTILVKRLAGEPGDHLRISKGKVFVGEKAVALRNALGEMVYNMPCCRLSLL